MNLEQQRALARARARVRIAKQSQGVGSAARFDQQVAQTRQELQANPDALSDRLRQPATNANAFLDLGKTMGSSIYAEPLAGLSGLAATVYDGPEAGAAVTQDVRNSLTVPMGPAGAQAMRSAVEGVPESVRKTLSNFGKRYNDFADLAAEAYGPAAGAAIKTLPTALAEVGGLKWARMMLRRSNLSANLRQPRVAASASPTGEALVVAPSPAELKAASRVLYDAIDNSGAIITPGQTALAAKKVQAALLRRTGVRRDRARDLWREVDDLTSAVQTGRGYPLPELVRMRDHLKQVANTKTDVQSAAAASMVDAIDETLAGMTKTKLTKGGKDVPQTLAEATELYRRSKRAEAIQKAIDESAYKRTDTDTALRMEFSKIAKGDEMKYFTPAEQKIINSIATGGEKLSGTNILRFLGKFGVGNGFMSTVLGGASGAGLSVALFGPAGWWIVPGVGTVSKKLAGRMTAGKANFALDTLRAGKDANRIVASYMRHTPRSRQVPDELAQLLMNPQVDLRGLSGAGNSIISQAKLQALENRAKITQLLAAQAAGAQASAQSGGREQ